MRINVKRHFILPLILLSVFVANIGCMGLYLRNYGLEGPYSEVINSFPDIPEGKGRIFIYMIPGDSNLWNTMGIITYMTVDTKVHEIKGATFTYVDVDEGVHKITADGVASGFSYKMGKNSLDVEIIDKDIKYIKIDVKDNVVIRAANEYKPIIIERDIAEREITNLKYYKSPEIKKEAKERT